MTYSLLDLNILKGKYLDDIINFVNKNRFDICTFQEVTGGIASDDGHTDCFQTLSNSLDLKGELIISFRLKNDSNSYFGNATFFSRKLILAQKELLMLKPYALVDNLPNGDLRWGNNPYSALFLKMRSGNNLFYVVNTHGAWSPIAKDTPEKVRQAKILYQKLRQIKHPFVLTGDFNTVKHTAVIDLYKKLSVNLTEKFAINNTLNSRLHYSRKIVPEGLAVDHIFVSPGIRVKKFTVLSDLDLSDHLPLTLEFEV